MKKQVIIAGGGAAGMAAGIMAARQGAQVTILEHTVRPGKKILSTGNGKCNMTNFMMPEDAYRGEQPDFTKKVLNQITVEKTLCFFRELGIVTMDRNGYVYPNSGQAASVLDALRFELGHQKVSVICECEVQKIKHDLTVVTNQGNKKADAVILATGSKAAPVTGSDGSGYKLAEALGHRIITPLPALVQLRCREKWYKQVSGVRSDAIVTLYVDQKAVASDHGEVQFTDYGISGIPVFQVSRYAARALHDGRHVTAELDLFPFMGEKETLCFLTERVRQLFYRPAEELLNGVLNKKLCSLLLKEAGITLHGTVESVGEGQIKKLARVMKSLVTIITATNPFDSAQVCSGGVDTREVNPATMESKLINHLYLAGELLDVDGICGGYNLQWAWSSGMLAGMNAGRNHI